MMRALVFRRGRLSELSALPAIAASVKDRSSTVWIDVDAPTAEELAWLGKAMSLHELTIEDLSKRNQRPKIEQYENYVFIVVRAFREGKAMGTAQMNMVLAGNCLATVSFEPVTAQDELYERVKKNRFFISLGADYLLYAVMDRILDSFFPYASELTEKLDALEDAVFAERGGWILNRAFEAKKQLFAFRKEVSPVRDMANSLARMEVRLIKQKTSHYFRDVYDHLVRIIDTIELNRDLVSNIMDAYLSQINNSLNKTMKRLTAISVMLMPPTLLASTFGMNFKVIPESDWEYGFYLIILLMVLMVGWSYYYFKKEDWL